MPKILFSYNSSGYLRTWKTERETAATLFLVQADNHMNGYRLRKKDIENPSGYPWTLFTYSAEKVDKAIDAKEAELDATYDEEKARVHKARVHMMGYR